MTRVTMRRVGTSLALAILGVAVAVAYAPSLLPEGVREGLATISGLLEPQVALLFAGAIVGIYALLSSWARRSEGTTTEFPPSDPEGATRDVSISGEQLTATFRARSVAELPAAPASDDPIRAELRTALVALYERTPERGDASADEYVESGAWTDDPYAAAFLSHAESLDYPLRHRLYAWLYPREAYEMRARRALTEVEAAYAESVSGYEPPATAESRGRRARGILAALGTERETEGAR